MRKLVLGALLVLILLPMSAMAAGNASNISVQGNIFGPVFSIDVTMQPSPPGWGLAYGNNSWFVGPGMPIFAIPNNFGPGVGLYVTAHAQNGVPYSVTVSDKLDGGKPSASKGKLSEYYVCWTFRNPTLPQPPPGLGLPYVCPGIGGLAVAGNCTMTTNRWEPTGKVLEKPLHIVEYICPTGLACGPMPEDGWMIKKFNMTGTDPVLFIGTGDTLPPAAPGLPPILGPGTSRNYDVRQFITLADSPLRVDGLPDAPGVGTFQYQQIHSYKMPITFTLTTL